MKISQIKVMGLFGLFDHDIPLDSENRITIIHGPNGYGKTTVLRLVDALFNNKRAYLRNTPFDELSVIFEDSSKLTLSKVVKDDIPVLHYKNNPLGGRKRQYTEKPVDTRSFRGFPYSIVEQEIPELDRVGARLWRNLRTGQLLDFEDVFERYSDELPLPRGMFVRTKPPKWLSAIAEGIPVRLIEAQRLLRIPDSSRISERRRRIEWSASVEAYSDELASSIKSVLAESAALSQALDRTFPQRLVDIRRDDVLPDDELKERINSVEEHRTKLIDAGLLDPQTEPAFQIGEDLRDHERRVLTVWVQDVGRKLGIYDELARKIDLFKDIINEYFQFKEMEIDKERGFIFRTLDGEALRPALLSSGEQHELILTYELLFKLGADALVMIDEPELSLHVAWQLRFLPNLQAIIELSAFDALIATHSPQIINDRWDLAVELKDPLAHD